MKGFNKWDVALLVIVLLSFVPGVVYYQQLPPQMPIHWDLYGQANRYADKPVGTFLFPAISLAVYFLMLFLPRIDPSRKNYLLFSSSYTVVRWTLQLFFILIYFLALYKALAPNSGTAWTDVSLLVPGAISLMIIILGNYMTRFRHNYFVGIRNPWTLASEIVWNKTHRLGGRLFVLSGVLGLVGLFLSPQLRMAFLLGPLLLTAAITSLYSYLVFRRLGS